MNLKRVSLCAITSLKQMEGTNMADKLVENRMFLVGLQEKEAGSCCNHVVGYLLCPRKIQRQWPNHSGGSYA